MPVIVIAIGVVVIGVVCWTLPLFAWGVFRMGVEDTVLSVIAACCLAGAFTVFAKAKGWLD